MKIDTFVRTVACTAIALAGLLFPSHARADEAAAPAARASASTAPAPDETEAAEDAASGAIEKAAERAAEKSAQHHDSGSDDFRFGQNVTIGVGEESHRDLVVYGGTVDIAGAHHGEVTVFGGHVKISGSQHGDVVIMGGGLDVSGKVEGSVAVIGGGAHLASTADVSGDLSLVGGGLQRDPGAQLHGGNVSVSVPSPRTFNWLPVLPWEMLGGFAAGLSFLSWLKGALLTLVVGLLVITLLPARVESAGAVLRERWLACLGAGFLAGVAVVPLMLVLLITCVGVVIPPLLYAIAKYFGLTVLFIVLGEALGRGVAKRELPPIGAFLVGFAVLSVVAFVTSPLPTRMILGWFGVGCALLTRFGTMRPWFKKRTPTLPAAPPATEVPPAPPTPSEPTPQE
jgi:hypothetical protein